jgi:uncharacterized membrane protein
LGFRDPEEADRVLSKLYILPREYLAAEDAVVFLDPLVGLAVGSAIGTSAGALAGSLTGYGIDDDFIKSLAETFPNNSSGLFLLFHKAEPEKILAELSGVKGKVLRTSLSPEQEKRLQEALSGS